MKSGLRELFGAFACLLLFNSCTSIQIAVHEVKTKKSFVSIGVHAKYLDKINLLPHLHLIKEYDEEILRIPYVSVFSLRWMSNGNSEFDERLELHLAKATIQYQETQASAYSLAAFMEAFPQKNFASKAYLPLFYQKRGTNRTLVEDTIRIEPPLNAEVEFYLIFDALPQATETFSIHLSFDTIDKQNAFDRVLAFDHKMVRKKISKKDLKALMPTTKRKKKRTR